VSQGHPTGAKFLPPFSSCWYGQQTAERYNRGIGLQTLKQDKKLQEMLAGVRR
jgi:hypothetical protein